MADYNLPPTRDVPTASAPSGEPDLENGYYALGTLKKQFLDYLGMKAPEIEEAKEARRYYHGAQWTAKELKALKRRKQPPVTSNRIVRKIDAVVGLVERL